MNIIRINPEKRWSDAVIYNNTVYYTAVPENLDADAEQQTTNALAAIDCLLGKLNSDKTKILDVTIYLADKADFQAMNRSWDAWVSQGSAPVRCTVEARLMRPEYRIEIKITAAVNQV